MHQTACTHCSTPVDEPTQKWEKTKKIAKYDTHCTLPQIKNFFKKHKKDQKKEQVQTGFGPEKGELPKCSKRAKMSDINPSLSPLQKNM